MRSRRPPLFRLLAFGLVFCLSPLRGREEASFDPPLEGIFLGLTIEVHAGRVVVQEVEPGSAAGRAGLQAGDEVVRLGPASGFTDFEAFRREVQGLRRGEPVGVLVQRGQGRVELSLVPDPGVLGDYHLLLGYLRDSRFLRSRDGFAALVADLEASVPPALRSAARASEAHEVLNRALGRFGTSHTAFIPPWTYRNLFAGEEEGSGGYQTGLLLEKAAAPHGESFYAVEVLDGSPAEGAGVLTGDEVLEVNGLAAGASPRRILAGYEAGRPRYALQVDRGETLSLALRRSAGAPPLEVKVTAGRSLSGLQASADSLRWYERDGRRLAYLHLWNLLSPRMPALVAGALATDGRYAEGLLLDLRGRGGQVAVMSRVLKTLKTSGRPLALLIDRETRSAKEIVAFQLKGRPQVVLVGERTAGAVLPGGYRRLTRGAVVMLPADPVRLKELAEGALEGKGVEPDIEVPRAGIYSGGADPIREAGLRALLDELRHLPRRRRL